MLEKKVSVIIPVYNAAKYLDKCLESICGQTYQNLEIILVNDGSTDDSWSICERWERKDKRINVINKVNRGPSETRNRGIDIATGEYIYFVDSDDYIACNLIEEVVNYMNKGYDMVSFNHYKVYERGRIEKSVHLEQAEYIKSNKMDNQLFFLQKLLKYKLGWETCTRIFRREIINEYNIRFLEDINLAEDLYFNLCYCAHSRKIFNLDKELYYYRQHSESIMSYEKLRLNVDKMDLLGQAVLKHYCAYEDCKDLLEIFPVIYFMLVDHVIRRYKNLKHLAIKEIRKAIWEELENSDFFVSQLEKLKKHKIYLRMTYSNIETKVILNSTRYFLRGDYVNYIICYQFIRLEVFFRRIYLKLGRKNGIKLLFGKNVDSY